MSTKNYVLLILFFMVSFGSAVNGQNMPGEKKENQSGMGMGSSMQNCMEQIASDSTMRKEMMTKIMDKMHGDTTAMRQMCMKMMNNPEMHKMMMKMMHDGMGGMGGMMNDDEMNSGKKMDPVKHDPGMVHTP